MVSKYRLQRNPLNGRWRVQERRGKFSFWNALNEEYGGPDAEKRARASLAYYRRKEEIARAWEDVAA